MQDIINNVKAQTVCEKNDKEISDELRGQYINVVEMGSLESGKNTHTYKISDSEEKVIFPNVNSCLAVIATTNLGNRILCHVGQFDCFCINPQMVITSDDPADNTPTMKASLKCAIQNIKDKLSDGESIKITQYIGNSE